MATIDPGIRISIPRGFHAETNQAVIGENRKLVIVPKSYSLSADPMEAPVALSLSHVVNGIPTRADSFDKYFEFCRDDAHGIHRVFHAEFMQRGDCGRQTREPRNSRFTTKTTNAT